MVENWRNQKMELSPKQKLTNFRNLEPSETDGSYTPSSLPVSLPSPVRSVNNNKTLEGIYRERF